MSILTTVAACGGSLSGVISVSSNEYRMSRLWCRMVSLVWLPQAMIWTGKRTRPRHAAVNARQPNRLALACWAGGGHGERGEPTAGADRGGAAARPARGGALAVVHAGGGGLSGRRPSSREIRDAA